MSLHIGLCDDQDHQLDILSGYLSACPQLKDYSLFQSTQAYEFLAMAQANPLDMVFLDVDMPGMNGIQLGKKIRECQPDTIIVYITSYEDYALKAFEVQAFHYLLKPISKEKFQEVLQKALDYHEKLQAKVEEKYFIIKTKKETLRLKVRDIHYFEKKGHKVSVHSRDGEVAYYDNFINLLSQVDPSDFIRCHQGYIVNVHRIRHYRNRHIQLDTGHSLPVSRTYIEKVRWVLAKMLFEGGKG